MLQKRFNLRSIFLSKGLMLPMIGMRGSLGVMILRDIENTDAIYQKLKELNDKERA
jgi:hypothetical protein